jgi:hypothetical protein
MSERDDAIAAIKSGQSVVVNGVQYTSENEKDLPGLEAFIGTDQKSKDAAVEQLKKDKAELEARLAVLESSSKPAAKTSAKDAEAESK